jgi:glycosyltransferase involved in cell wall biosynthesis
VVFLIEIVLVKSDPIMNLPSMRDQKIIRSLRKKYSILVLGWNREGTPKDWDNYQSGFRLFNLRAPYGSAPYGALRLAAYFPFFWGWTFVKLCVYGPKCVHACDLGTVPPCYLYKILFRRKLVFDVFDRYAMAYIPKNRNIFFKMLYSLVNWLEENFAKSSDVLINISDEMLQTYKKRPKNCSTIMNCSEDHIINVSKAKSNGFRLLFTGHIRTGRGLEILPEIVKELKDVELIITGRVEDKKLQKKIDGISNITYQGFLDHDQVLHLETSSDVMIALYDLNLQTQNKFVMGNKLFESMMCGIPIITNVAHEIVNETGCGIIVAYDNKEQIKEAIITLRDNPELRKSLGANSRKAFLEKYNWTIMEEKLYKIYDDLLNK